MAERGLRAIRLGPGEGESVSNPLGGPVTYKLRGGDTGGTLSAFESNPFPGEGPPLHVHRDADETMYVLEGSFRFRLEDEFHDAPAGTFVFIPRDTPHTWQNVGPTPGRLFFLFTPAALDRFFGRLAELPEDGSMVDEFRRLGQEENMDVLGPPLAVSHPL